MNVGKTDIDHENWVESPLYGDRYPRTKPVPNSSTDIVQYDNISRTLPIPENNISRQGELSPSSGITLNGLVST